MLCHIILYHIIFRGTSAAAKDAAGRVYTPVAALLSRWIMGKFYMWLEWRRALTFVSWILEVLTQA